METHWLVGTAEFYATGKYKEGLIDFAELLFSLTRAEIHYLNTDLLTLGLGVDIPTAGLTKTQFVFAICRSIRSAWHKGESIQEGE